MHHKQPRAGEVTVERLENAIKITAYCIVRHDLPQLILTLKRLEAERGRLMSEGDAIEYARRLLSQPKRIESYAP
jgi:hypothetical protein